MMKTFHFVPALKLLKTANISAAFATVQRLLVLSYVCKT